jgi:excisionase family DNA binding protein
MVTAYRKMPSAGPVSVHKDNILPEMSNDNHLLTYKKAAEFLGVSEKTIWTLCKQGDIPTVRILRSVRIDPFDIKAFIESHKATGQSQDEGMAK